MSWDIITQPAEYPVSLEEAKAWLHVDDATHDAVIQPLVGSATAQAESYCGRLFMRHTVDYFRDAFPSGRTLVFPWPLVAVASVGGVFYTPDGGTEQTFAATDYIVDVSATRARLVLGVGKSWPSDLLVAAKGVRVRLDVGWQNPEDVPEPVKTAIKLYVAHYFANREDVVFGVSAMPLPRGSEALLARYVVR